MAEKNEKYNFSPRTEDLLSGFKHRMEIGAVAEALHVAPQAIPDNVKSQLGETNTEILDNVVLLTMLFIKSQDIQSEKCTLRNISNFYDSEDVKFIFPWIKDSFALARFVIVKILQNDGYRFEKLVYSPEAQSMTTIYFRLLDEKENDYKLTEKALDYLYRCNEIDEVLQYSVIVFKIKEYTQKKNYSKAVAQSIELLDQLNQLKRSMENFITECKINLYAISTTRYAEQIDSFYELMNKETDTLNELLGTIEKDESEIREAQAAGYSPEQNEKESKNIRNLEKIEKNLRKVIKTQRRFLVRLDEYKKDYRQILKDYMQLKNSNLLNFQKDVIPAIKKTENLYETIDNFLLPLVKIRVPKLLPPELLTRYSAISQKDLDKPMDYSTIPEEEDPMPQIIENIQVSILIGIIEKIKRFSKFTLEDLINSISTETLKQWAFQQTLSELASELFQESPIDIKQEIQCEYHEDSQDGREISFLRDIYRKLPYQYQNVKFIVETSQEKTSYVAYDNEGLPIHYSCTNYQFTQIKEETDDE